MTKEISKLTGEQLADLLAEMRLVETVAEKLQCGRNTVRRRLVSTNPFAVLKKAEAVKAAKEVIEIHSSAYEEMSVDMAEISRLLEARQGA